MRAFQINFERGFALHYPDAFGTDKGVVFVFHRSQGKNAWLLFLDVDGEIKPRAVTPPPELYVPIGAAGRAWHGHGLEAILGFALEPEPEKFDGHLKRIEGHGWIVHTYYGQVFCCLEINNVPEKWAWIGECGDCPFCSLTGGCPLLKT